jgi:hypothetical protein
MAKKGSTPPPVIDDPEYTLIEQYVTATRQQHEREEAMSAAMQALAPDNAVFSLQCEEMHKLLSAFALKAFGEVAVDWLGWWMWECDFGQKPARMWQDGTEFDVTKLENLYRFCLRGMKTETPQP